VVQMGEISPNRAVPGRDQFERLVQHLGDLLQRCRPVPFIRDLANQDSDTPRSFATCTGCSRGSSSLFLAGPVIAHLLSCLEMDLRCLALLTAKLWMNDFTGC
jgi:hypothetical protein